MRASAIRTSFVGCPPSLAALGFGPPTQTLISLEKEYEVCAFAVYRGVVFVQIVNDLKIISWLPAWAFKIQDASLPSDWIVSFLDEEPSLVVGPKYVAADAESYKRMVELEPEAVQCFWERQNIGPSDSLKTSSQ